MPIEPNFPKNHQVMGMHRYADGEHFHFVWEKRKTDTPPGKQPALGVHGTMVAVDWGSCIADGGCMEACPVQVFQWYKTENDVPPEQITNATSAGTGSSIREGRKDYTDKSDPIREHECIWCMACVKICPTRAIKVSQSNLEYHQQAEDMFHKRE